MFTGLVQEVGTVASLDRRNGGATARISAPLSAALERGDSVLVNGVCLTATGVDSSEFETDLSPETLRRSSLGEVEAGDRVNLELPVRIQDRLGGHLVQGHVDGVAELHSVSEEGGARSLRLRTSPAMLRYVVEKGSVTLDGVSLTVMDVDDEGFTVSLIPETLERTNLRDASPGRKLNLEVDLVAKYVEKLIGAPRS